MQGNSQGIGLSSVVGAILHRVSKKHPRRF